MTHDTTYRILHIMNNLDFCYFQLHKTGISRDSEHPYFRSSDRFDYPHRHSRFRYPPSWGCAWGAFYIFICTSVIEIFLKFFLNYPDDFRAVEDIEPRIFASNHASCSPLSCPSGHSDDTAAFLTYLSAVTDCSCYSRIPKQNRSLT
jgi:hypothetical protein